jgi:HAD superfamily hydrolase (TIGR01509 family)
MSAGARTGRGGSGDAQQGSSTPPPSPGLPAAVVFDWDGTIVDTLPLIYRANVTVLGELGITMSRSWFREKHSPDWRRGYRELGVPEHLWDRTAARWAEEMGRMQPRALPWVRRALRQLRGNGVRLGLVTASTRGVVEPSLERLNLAGLFETAWYADDVREGKPHPEALLLALRDLGLAAEQTVYVGDTTVDLEMARAAGARFAAVGTTTPESVFRAAGVDRVWPGVGAWADDLLASAATVKRSAARPSPRSSGTA